MKAEKFIIPDRVLEVFDDLIGCKKDARILDVGAGTGRGGIEVTDASGLKEDGWETGGTSFWVPNGQPLETN